MRGIGVWALVFYFLFLSLDGFKSPRWVVGRSETVLAGSR